MTTEILDDFEEWQEYQQRRRSAEAARDRAAEASTRATREFTAAAAAHTAAVETALRHGEDPPAPPVGPDRAIRSAVVRASQAVIETRQQEPDVLAGLLNRIEAEVTRRGAARNRKAMSFLAGLDRLQVEQNADQSLLQRARVAANRTRRVRPSPADRTPRATEIGEYTARVRSDVDWGAMVPIADLGYTVPSKVERDLAHTEP